MIHDLKSNWQGPAYTPEQIDSWHRAIDSIERTERSGRAESEARGRAEAEDRAQAAAERQRIIDIHDRVKSFGDPTIFMLTAVVDALRRVECSHPEFKAALARIDDVRAAYAARDALAAKAKERQEREAAHWRNRQHGTSNADGSFCFGAYSECAACQRVKG